MSISRNKQARYQMQLLPPTISEYVSEDDIVRYIDEIVEEFDMQDIESKYSHLGRGAYDPKMLTKILIFGSMRGIRGSRELEREVRENLKFMFLANGAKPSYRTIARYRQNHMEELSGLLNQTIKIGIEEKFITLDTVVIDGTKMGAYAGRNTFKDKEELKKVLDKLEKEVNTLIKESVELDKQEIELGSLDKLPKELSKKTTRIKKIREALLHVEEEEKKGAKELKKVSTTDPESRYMKSKGINPSYNCQAAVDADSDMIVGGYITNNGNDSAELINIVEEIESNTKGEKPKRLLADKGYGRDKKLLAELEEKEIEGYISVPKEEDKGIYSIDDFDYDEENNEYKCPAGKTLKVVGETKTHFIYSGSNSTCMNCPLKSKCVQNPKKTKCRRIKVSKYQGAYIRNKERVESEVGTKKMKKRSGCIERLFGCIKHAKKFRRFVFTGMNKVNNIWRFELAIINVMKLINLRRERIMRMT